MTDYKPEDYIKYRIERARETIEEVQTYIENKILEYSHKQIVRMLLCRRSIACQT